MSEKTKLFKKYPSITNTYDEEFIEKVKSNGFSNMQYYVTEKIHGANTQIIYDCVNDSFEYAKRTAIIDENEKCYNVQKLLTDVKPNIKTLLEYLKPTVDSEIVILRVFGEVFGGSYPHKDVKIDNHASKVQKGVWYSNENKWKAFDISYTTVGGTTRYLCGYDFIQACDVSGIDTVPVLAVVNSLDEALKYPNNGASVVFKDYDLPEIEDNIMEGVVIKPWLHDLWLGQSRVVFKNKSEQYKERTHKKKINVQSEYSDNLVKALEESLSYATDNRVHNVISHEGEVSVKDIGRISGLVAKDALEEFLKYGETWSLLEKVERKVVTKNLQREISKLVRKEIIGV